MAKYSFYLDGEVVCEAFVERGQSVAFESYMSKLMRCAAANGNFLYAEVKEKGGRGRCVPARMAALSHLSDAQELIDLGYREAAGRVINAVKAILLRYMPETDADESTLDGICEGNSKAKE